MKTVLYFIVTLLVSAGSLLAAMNTKYPFLLFAVAFGVWVVFFWGYSKRAKKEAEKRSREQLFENYMRTHLRNR